MASTLGAEVGVFARSEGAIPYLFLIKSGAGKAGFRLPKSLSGHQLGNLAGRDSVKISALTHGSGRIKLAKTLGDGFFERAPSAKEIIVTCLEILPINPEVVLGRMNGNKC